MVEQAVLKDLLTFTRDGEWGSGEPVGGHKEMAVIRGTDFGPARHGDVSRIPFRFISDGAAERKALQVGDVLIETAGGTRDQPTGRTLLVTEQLLTRLQKPATCASFARFLRVDPSRVDSGYLFWWLQHLYVSGEMAQHQVQHTGVARFQYTRFAETTLVPLLPIAEQRAIAAALGAFDGKIELNRRMHETLEAMARALFKSWFVDFDPVRAKAEGRAPFGMNAEMATLFPDSFEDSEWGPIPKGWSRASLDDVIETIIDHRGKTPTKLGGEWAERGLPAISAKNVKQGRIVAWDTVGFVGEELYLKWMRDELREGDVLLTSEAPLGELYYLTRARRWCLSQRLFGLRVKPSRVSASFFYHWLASERAQTDMKGRATGTTVLGIRQSELRRVDVLLPHVEVSRAFHDIAHQLLVRADVAEAESDALRQTRDLLLPRLLSGELRIKDAEKFVEAAS